MKKNRKTLKGMTLMEIIISLAILAVMTLILVQTSTVINTYIKSARKVNQTVIEQAPVAEMGLRDINAPIATSVQVVVSGIVLRADAYELGNEPGTKMVSTNVTDAYGSTVATEVAVAAEEIGGNLRMQYLYIETPTSVTTSVTTVAGP